MIDFILYTQIGFIPLLLAYLFTTRPAQVEHFKMVHKFLFQLKKQVVDEMARWVKKVVKPKTHVIVMTKGDSQKLSLPTENLNLSDSDEFKNWPEAYLNSKPHFFNTYYKFGELYSSWRWWHNMTGYFAAGFTVLQIINLVLYIYWSKICPNMDVVHATCAEDNAAILVYAIISSVIPFAIGLTMEFYKYQLTENVLSIKRDGCYDL